ncbi:inner membrane ABC transporter permease protein YcjP [Peptococcaceae bacterium CEB3]|nr:inner membrane ABC transporter permease protein YcjP [Peptococcaceae bacterium CEB3]
MRIPRHVIVLVRSVLLVLALLWLLPGAYTLFLSLRSDVGNGFTLSNLWAALSIQGLGRFFVNSLVVTLSTVALVTGCASLSAYAISRLSFRGRSLVYASLLLTLMMPFTALAVPFFIINKTLHLFNNYLGLILPYSALGIPFALVILKNFFDTFPRELEEAAIIDGAGVFRIFFSLVLPNSISSLTVVMIWTFLNAWNEFLLALLFMSDNSMKTISLAPLFYEGVYCNVVGRLMAILVVISIPVLVFYLALQQQLEKGVQGGALKG